MLAFQSLHGIKSSNSNILHCQFEHCWGSGAATAAQMLWPAGPFFFFTMLMLLTLHHSVQPANWETIKEESLYLADWGVSLHTDYQMASSRCRLRRECLSHLCFLFPHGDNLILAGLRNLWTASEHHVSGISANQQGVRSWDSSSSLIANKYSV